LSETYLLLKSNQPMRAIILKKPGDIMQMTLKDIDLPKSMTKDDIFIRHTCIGINFDDILIRKGAWEIEKDEKQKYDILGLEGVGIIEKVGSSITRFKIGQRVGYGFAPIGAYCEKRVINANYCVAIPEDISDENAASILRKGLVAHSLLFRCHVPRKGQTILVTGAGSGVGQIIVRWAKYSGLRVIGAISSDFKKDTASAAGCDAVVNYKNLKEAIDKVSQLTDKSGVNAVYDCVGKNTFEFCIKSLHVFGTFVSYGNTSGNIPAFDPNILEAKSLFFTKPRFELYKSNRNELVISAHELFESYKKGAILTNISRYNFSAIPSAHKDIEAQKVTGSVIANIN